MLCVRVGTARVSEVSGQSARALASLNGPAESVGVRASAFSLNGTASSSSDHTSARVRVRAAVIRLIWERERERK